VEIHIPSRDVAGAAIGPGSMALRVLGSRFSYCEFIEADWFNAAFSRIAMIVLLLNPRESLAGCRSEASFFKSTKPEPGAVSSTGSSVLVK